jgi:hypothetical protein
MYYSYWANLFVKQQLKIYLHFTQDNRLNTYSDNSVRIHLLTPASYANIVLKIVNVVVLTVSH